MINASTSWEKVQTETLLPEMFVEITYEVTEPGLQSEATVTGSNPEDFSDVEQVLSGLDKNSERYATLDYGCWGLDGGFEYFDGSPTDPGYVTSDYSEADGSLNTYPTITLEFAERRDIAIPGMIITWGEAFGVWAEEFRISTYNANGLVLQSTFVGNTSVTSNVSFNIVNYSRITIEILKWSHPYQRPRCIDIFLGLRNVYTKADLVGYEHKQSADLLSAKLPESDITFKLRNDDNRWNPDSPLGAESYLAEKQEVKVRYGMALDGGVEWIKGGTFWLSEWNTPTNGIEVNFVARDAIAFMTDIYRGVMSGTLYDIAVAAFEEADLTTLEDGSVRYIVDDSLRDITTNLSSDNSEYTIAEILQMVANAGDCVFYQDREGLIHIEPRNRSYSGYTIDPTISYTHPEYEMNKPLKAVSVKYGSEGESAYVEVSSRGEIQTVENPMIVTRNDALRVGGTAAEVLTNRKVMSGDFRADLRMDVLDNIMVISKYASNIVAVTDVSYATTGGSFRGRYTGRVLTINLETNHVYSNEVYSGELW